MTLGSTLVIRLFAFALTLVSIVVTVMLTKSEIRSILLSGILMSSYGKDIGDKVDLARSASWKGKDSFVMGRSARAAAMRERSA